MGQYDKAREIIERCCYEVPAKQSSMALIEYAKHFEILGDIERAASIVL